MRIPFKVETLFNKIFKPQIITIVETEINGRKSQKIYGKSLVANFLQMIYNHFNQNDLDFAVPAAPFTARTNFGVNFLNAVITTSNPTMSINAATTDNRLGIILGTGNTAPVPGDYKLQTIIANGAGAGALNYQAQTAIQGTTIAGANTSFILERLFTNTSGAAVGVNELGLAIFVTSNSFLIYRDVLPSTDSIPNLGTYRVSITFQITT